MSDGRKTRLPHNLDVARGSLNALEGVEVLREFEWDAGISHWVLLVRLNVVDGTETVPARSAWYVLVSPLYPWGNIDIYPAKRDGLEETYHHQSLNLRGHDQHPWRTGKICVDTGVQALGPALDPEPYNPNVRLRWRLVRAIDWLRAADRGELIVPGEPFELPDFGAPSTPLVAFWEDRESFGRWEGIEEDRGFVRLTVLSDDPEVVVARCFQDRRGNDLIVPEWGVCIGSGRGGDSAGLWVRLRRVPHLLPWRAPLTWGELIEALDKDDLPFPEGLRELLPPLRDRRPHHLLIGCPIPDLAGGEPEILYWLAIRLPRLASGKRRGFRDGEQAAWVNERTRTFRTDARIPWAKSQNWSPSDLSGRGRLPSELTERRVVVVGGGALGSVVSEMLVRGGVSQIFLSEGDSLQAGNLVRHTATLEDVGSDKGPTVVSRLNAASPHANVTHVGPFPPTDPKEADAICGADVVIDLTGDLSVLPAITEFDWKGEKQFFSVSLGLQAKRVFCFSAVGARFPHEEFLALMQPWLQMQIGEAKDMEVPREGIGCWHPVFPARVYDVWMLAAAAVKFVEQRIVGAAKRPELVVFEQVGDAAGFAGIRRCDTPSGHE